MGRHEDWATLLASVTRPGDEVAPAAADDRLERAMTLAQDVGESAVGCSLTQDGPDGFRTPVFWGSLAFELDVAQYRDQSGPCVTAALTGRPDRIPDVALAHSYPSLTAPAQERGVRSVLSLPVPGTAADTALNFYANAPTCFDSDRSRAVATLLSRCVARLLGAPGVTANGDSDEARAAGRRVQQAQAQVAEERGLPVGAAFLLLARRAQREARHLDQVASAVLDELAR